MVESTSKLPASLKRSSSAPSSTTKGQQVEEAANQKSPSKKEREEELDVPILDDVEDENADKDYADESAVAVSEVKQLEQLKVEAAAVENYELANSYKKQIAALIAGVEAESSSEEAAARKAEEEEEAARLAAEAAARLKGGEQSGHSSCSLG